MKYTFAHLIIVVLGCTAIFQTALATQDDAKFKILSSEMVITNQLQNVEGTRLSPAPQFAIELELQFLNEPRAICDLGITIGGCLERNPPLCNYRIDVQESYYCDVNPGKNFKVTLPISELNLNQTSRFGVGSFSTADDSGVGHTTSLNLDPEESRKIRKVLDRYKEHLNSFSLDEKIKEIRK